MYTHRHLMTLLAKLGYSDDMRHELVHNFTGGRTSSTRELTHVELQEICLRVYGMIGQSTVNADEAMRVKGYQASIRVYANAKQSIADEAMRVKRSQVLTVATRLGIKETNGWDRFNAFMRNKSIYRKNLNRYTYGELKDLLKQLHSMEYRNRKSAYNPGTKAWHKRFGGPPTMN